MNKTTLKFKWTVSKARDSYGYNICSLWINGQKVSSCNGGGYDMKGTALGNWVTKKFETKLLKLTKEFYGLSFHDPNYNPGKAMIDGQTIEDREKKSKSCGLERYQAFYHESSKIPTKNHIIPLIDGACGVSEVEKILNAMGYQLEYVDEESSMSIYLLYEGETRKEKDNEE